MLCEKCGKKIADNSFACPYCGTKINNDQSDEFQTVINSQKPKSKLPVVICSVIGSFLLVGSGAFALSRLGDRKPSPVSDPASVPSSSESDGSSDSAPTAKSPDNPETSAPADDLSGFDTPVPVIYINTKDTSENVMDFVTKPVAEHVSESIASWTPGYKLPPAPYYEDCSITVTDADGNVLIDSADSQVKVRGNWTTSYDKKPLRIKFDQKQSILGLNDSAEMKNWVLLAEYKDASMLRNKTAFEISRELLGNDGLYASDAAFTEVYINDNYWGLYLLAELQQVNSDRVNITKPEPDQQSPDIGYFLEFDGYYDNEDDLHSFFVDYNDNAPLTPFDGNNGSGKTMTCLNSDKNPYKSDVGFSIKSDINSPEQRDFISSFVNNTYDIMYNAAYLDEAYVLSDDGKEIVKAPDISPEDAVRKVVDVDSLADVYIINEIACDADIYWSSFFMSADFGENGSRKLTFQAPWDFDSALGNKDRCPNADSFYAANIVPDVNSNYLSINPWLAVLMYEDWFQDIIREKWSYSYDNGVYSRALDMIADDKVSLAQAFEKNYAKWNNIINNSSFSGELSKESQKCKTHAQAADQLYSWLEKRISFMNENWHD